MQAGHVHHLDAYGETLQVGLIIVGLLTKIR